VPPRELDWEGLLNVRDLGGQPLVGGGETRFRAYVRADNVEALTTGGWRALVDYGVRTVVDLRFEGEREIDPPAGLPIRGLHHPIVPQLGDPDRAEIDTLAMSADPPESTTLVYGSMLDRYRERFGEAVTAIASADDGGTVLFHCMAGKDRTGLIAALLLSVAGVERRAIAADYALSAGNLGPAIDAWVSAGVDERERDLRRRIGAAPAEAMLAVLEALDEGHGGPESYLVRAGVAPGLLDRVRSHLAG
jgi:protein-tyrosine phosphatase